MRRWAWLVGSMSVLLLTAQTGLASPSPQGDPPEYFPETGHTVRQPFIDYFNRTGGEAQHGAPITGDYVDPHTRLLVQYFKNSRLEWHPGNPEPYRVQLGLLGDELGKREPPLTLSQLRATGGPTCEHVEATGQNLCHAFRDYYYQHGGLDRFGYPISGYRIEDNRTVQYFQRARMEWHPEKPRGEKVQLAPLGSLYYHHAGLDENRLQPRPGSASLGIIRTIVVRGAVINTVTVSRGTQTTYVYVTDQLGQPIGNAAVSLVIQYPHANEVHVLPPTSPSGISFRIFSLPPLSPGTLVPMKFIIGYDGLMAETRTGFLIWH